MLLCKKVSLCKSSLKIRMGCSHDLLSVLQRGWLVPGTSVGRNINPACLFERPPWSGNESLLAFLERPPWSKKYQDSASLTWLSLEARKTLCVREMALRARRRCERRCASVKWYFVPTVRREMSPRWLS